VSTVAPVAGCLLPPRWDLFAYQAYPHSAEMPTVRRTGAGSGTSDTVGRVARMKFETFAAQFRSRLGDQATRSLYRVRMAAGWLVLGTICLGALVWITSSPTVAFWVYVAGGSILVVIVVVGLRIVLSEASNYQDKRATIGDLARMGALVSNGRPRTEPPGGPTD
jgi:hypothetical protein